MKYLKKSLITLLILVELGIIMSFTMVTAHFIPVNSHSTSTEKEFYLSNNGNHIDIILYKEGSYKAYGWGSEIFYTKVDDWDDMSYSIALQALFTKPESLMRVINYNRKSSKWVKVNCSLKQYDIIEKSINDSYNHDTYDYDYKGTEFDHVKFYKAYGNYNAFHTCNTWVNNVLDNAKLKCCAYSLTSNAITDLY